MVIWCFLKWADILPLSFDVFDIHLLHIQLQNDLGGIRTLSSSSSSSPSSLSLLLSLTLFPIYSCNHITGNSLILNLVVCPCILVKPIPLKQIFLKLTPRGVRDKVVLAPVHDGFVGGDAANVLPAVIHWMGQAVTLILRGDWPESKMGLGIEGSEDGSGRWTCSVLGSMAHCHSPVASNSRSTARGCCAFWARTFWLLGTFERKKMRGTLIT